MRRAGNRFAAGPRRGNPPREYQASTYFNPSCAFIDLKRTGETDPSEDNQF
jgi:hypothetical protein